MKRDGRAVALLASAAVQVSEQHRRAGPPADQTAGPAGARLRQLPNGQTDAGRLRGDGDDQEGAGSQHRRSRHPGTDHLRRQPLPGRRLKFPTSDTSHVLATDQSRARHRRAALHLRRDPHGAGHHRQCGARVSGRRHGRSVASVQERRARDHRALGCDSVALVLGPDRRREPIIPTPRHGRLPLVGNRRVVGTAVADPEALRRSPWLGPATCRETIPVERRDPLVEQMQHFLRVVRPEAPPLVSGRDGAATLAATLAVGRSAATGFAVRPEEGAKQVEQEVR